jgi:hypothetical protein
MFQVAIPNSGKANSGKAISYRAHVDEADQAEKSQLTRDHSLVMFHYVTRSRDDFLKRKINLRSGVYASEFAALATAAGPYSQLQGTFDAFEAHHGFDGDHAICKQGAALSAAYKLAAAVASTVEARAADNTEADQLR